MMLYEYSGDKVTIPDFARRQGYTITQQLETLVETVANDDTFQQFLVGEVNAYAKGFFDSLAQDVPNEEWTGETFYYRFDFYEGALGQKFAEIIQQTWEQNNHDGVDRLKFERFSALAVTGYLEKIFQEALKKEEQQRGIEGVDIYPQDSWSYYLSEPKAWRNVTRVVIAPLEHICTAFGTKPYSVYFQVKLAVYRSAKPAKD